jgi:hypothetical protein
MSKPEEEGFNLYRVIRAVLDSSPDLNPKNLAFEVFNLIPSKHRDAALMAALPQAIRVESNKDRNFSAKSRPSKAGTDKSWSPLVLASQRDPYAARYWVGKNEYKRLGDFQISDMDFMISQGLQMQKAGKAKQEKFEKLRQLMLASKVTYLNELDRAKVIPIIQGEVQ